jgi:hypothetical protein
MLKRTAQTNAQKNRIVVNIPFTFLTMGKMAAEIK